MAKFKIISKKADGKQLIHFYDNETQDIKNELGIPMELCIDPRCLDLIHDKPDESNYTYEKYKKTFQELRIQLGLGCNYHCKYCIATHGDEHGREEVPIAMPPKQSAINLVKLLKANNIKPKHIVLWGGEPFVYYKTMVELIPRLKELYDNVSMGTITNGSLLTVEKVKFLLKYEVGLTISHDGPSFKHYRNDKDPLDDPEVIKAIQYYYDHCDCSQRLNINIVVTPENCEILKLPEYFEQKIGRPIRLNFECIVKNDKQTDKIVTPFNEQYRKILLNNLVQAASVEPNDKNFGSIRSHTTRFIDTLVNKLPGYCSNTPCSAIRSTQVAIDMQGNILACHGTDPTTSTIGHISQIEQVVNSRMTLTSNRRNCNDCVFKMLCRGGCPMIDQEDLDHYCTNLKIWYSGIFIAAWKILFNSTILRIEPIED